MTTIIPFIPSTIQAPSIPMTLDGTGYTIVVTWNVSAQRYYINVYDTAGNWIITVPLISSPPSRNIESVSWDSIRQVLNVKMVDPAFWPIPLGPEGVLTAPGTIVDYYLEGFQPATYNGKFRCLHIDETHFTAPMPTDPGPVLVMGVVDRLLNMIQSVFKTSTLVFRNGAFEVNP